MSILDYFTDWERSTAAIHGATTSYDPSTGVVTQTFGDTGGVLVGIKYNRSAAERYFSERWAPDVSEVFVVEASALSLSLTAQHRLVFGSSAFAIDSVVNVAEQSEVVLIGLKEFF